MFDSSKPKVSKIEFREILSQLVSKNFTQKERWEIEKIFHADLDESTDTQKGIDAEEIKNGIKWMRENMNKHIISDEKLSIIEKELVERL